MGSPYTESYVNTYPHVNQCVYMYMYTPDNVNIKYSISCR